MDINDRCVVENLQYYLLILVAMGVVRKISNFFTFVFITQYKLKKGKVSEKSIFSISKPYWKVSEFLRQGLLRNKTSAKCGVLLVCALSQNRPRGYKTFSMLNSAEHEILNTHQYKKNHEIQLIPGSYKPRMPFSCSLMLKCQQLLAF